MTKAQIQWASQHDWFLREDNGAIICRDYKPLENLQWEEIETRFTNYRALRQWAGY